MDYLFSYDSPLGPITLASDGTQLVGLWFDGQVFDRHSLALEHTSAELPIFKNTTQWLDAYFLGNNPGPTPPLAPRGTDFQMAVWKLLTQIPYGETCTYGELAKELAQLQKRPCVAAQAVGGAVGRNPIAILIPCHRVIGAKGQLVGYAAGVERKKWLLSSEQGTIFVR